MSFERFNPHQQQPEGENNEDLSEIDLGELNNSVEEYNLQYNWGTMLAEAITGESKEKMTVGELEKIHERALEKTGLNLEPVRGVATLYSQEGEKPSSEMRLNLADGDKFVNYLSVLDEEHVSANQVDGLKAVAESLTTQLTQQYQLDNPNDERMIELLGHLDQIIQQYRRLDEQSKTGLTESVEELATHLDVARRGYLREFVLANNEQLLTTDKHRVFGPYDWWADSTPESFKDSYWKKALEATKKIGENPKADELYRNVVQNLKGALLHSKTELKNKSTEDEFSDQLESERKEKLIAIDDLYELVETMEQRPAE